VSAQNRCNYHIYCIVSKDVTSDDLECLKEVVRKFSEKSKITFLYETGQYRKARIPNNLNSLSEAIYYRFMLPDLVNGVDKIIYIDSDTAILKDLIEMDNISLNDNLLSGSLDFMNDDAIWAKNFHKYCLPLEKNRYVNSGVLIMNLKKMRKDKLPEKWLQLSQKKIKYPDQDILNNTCMGKIDIFDSKYNIEIFSKIKMNINAKKIKDAVILHYIYPKPWMKKTILGGLWWKYAKMTKFYNHLLLKYSMNLKHKNKKGLLMG